MLPTYSGRGIDDVVSKLFKIVTEMWEDEPEELPIIERRLSKVSDAEGIVKFAISTGMDLSSFDDFIRERKVSKELAVELFGWAHYWEDKWDR